ncbi:MAG TPA: hypothetical protein VGF85_03605 [Opitutaceae bacterium]|jgi:hypothetical protein
MDFFTNKPSITDWRKLGCCLGFCFGLGVTRTGGTPYLIEFGDSGLEVRQAPISQPYLCKVGAPSLRFREPPPIPIPDEPKSATEKQADAAHPLSKPSPSPQNALIPAAKPAVSVVTEAHSAPPPDTGQPSIIPDEMRPRVRSEEFLPFFQLPTSAPQPPNSIPPSSATYQQK